MNHKKESVQASVVQSNRPQTPKPPYPYREEEVSYTNDQDSVTLAGTLTLPSKQAAPYPSVLLIAGMGPNDRNYTMFDHALFLVLADYLTRQGIAVLRVDKRGIGKSTGTYDATLTSEDFARDVHAGVTYLKNRKDIKQIGLIGHSEGGLIASMVAAQSPDVDFLVLMAGAVSLDYAVEQTAMQLCADGASEQVIQQDSQIRSTLLSIVRQEQDSTIAAQEMSKAIERYFVSLSDEQKIALEQFAFTIKQSNVQAIIAGFNSPWYRYFLGCDPTKILTKIKIPVLAVNGDCDFITSSQIALPRIEQALKAVHNKDYTVLGLAQLNHWFQTCKTGALEEYSTLEETMSPSVLQIITEWILKRT